MNAIEKRARGLLARAYEADGLFGRAGVIRNPSQYMEKPDRRALGCIIAALTPPEGFVLVRAEALEDLLTDAELYVYGTEHRPEYIDRKLINVREAKAILADRPEVPNVND